MSPRKRPTYRRFQRRPTDNRNRDSLGEQAIDSAARTLAANHELAELRSLVERTREAFEWADQEAQDRPSPEALSRFRIAARRLAEAERALALAES